MWRSTLVVMRKELREAVRDRRSLGAALFYAVWGPAVMSLAIMALAKNRDTDQPLTLPVLGAEHAVALTSFLHEKRVVIVHAPPDLRARVRARDLPVGLFVGDSYADRFESQRPAPVTIVFDSASTASASQAARVRSLLTEYSRRIGDSRAILRGVAPTALAPLRLLEEDQSTAASRAASVLGTFPIFLLVAAFVGGMGFAADEMAGERERRSLESLLSHPIRRGAIVAGKWAAASLIAVTTVTLTLAGASVLLQHPRVQSLDLPIGLSLADGLTMWLVIAPLALMVTSVQLLLALFARTYKEAQTQLSLLMFVPMIPGFLFAFGSIQVKPWMEFTPVIGQQVLLTGILRGEPPAAAVIAAVALITMAMGVAVASTTARLLSHEGIVRRMS
jgi:sodium transport system permease protein